MALRQFKYDDILLRYLKYKFGYITLYENLNNNVN